MEKVKTYRSADNVLYNVVVALLAVLWMLSPYMRSALRQDQLVEFTGVAAAAPHVESYGKGTRTIVIDVHGLSDPFSLDTYTYSALSRSFLSDVVEGDTVILGLEKDVYDRRVVRREEGKFLEGTNVHVFTVATPARSYATVDDFNAAEQKDDRLGWLVGPLALGYLAFCWQRRRRLDKIALPEAAVLFGVLLAITFAWNKYY